MGEDEGTLIPDDDDDGDHDIDYDGIKGRDLLASADTDSIESQYDIHRDHRPRQQQSPHLDDVEAGHESIDELGSYTDADLEAIRAIGERIAPVKDRRAARERIDKEDVYTLTHSLDFAEQQLQDRLRKNLEMYHDLQKLKKKPHSDFTTQDLLFVKQSVCADGVCLNGDKSLVTSLTLAISVCTAALALF